MARTKSVELTQAEKREVMYSTVKIALKKLKRGEELTEQEARLTDKLYRTFLELFDVFQPSIKKTLLAQQAEIAALLEGD